jgi:hypothetical protein
MPNPGDWGFYGSYLVIVRVIEGVENLSNKTNHRRSNTYFRGVLIDLQNNYSIETSDKLLVSNFWEKESCNDPIILGKFELSEVAYNNWFQNKIQRANSIANQKQGKKVIENTMGNSIDSTISSRNSNAVPKVVSAVPQQSIMMSGDDDEYDNEEDNNTEDNEEDDGDLNEIDSPTTGKFILK